MVRGSVRILWRVFRLQSDRFWWLCSSLFSMWFLKWVDVVVVIALARVRPKLSRAAATVSPAGVSSRDRCLIASIFCWSLFLCLLITIYTRTICAVIYDFFLILTRALSYFYLLVINHPVRQNLILKWIYMMTCWWYDLSLACHQQRFVLFYYSLTTSYLYIWIDLLRLSQFIHWSANVFFKYVPFSCVRTSLANFTKLLNYLTTYLTICLTIGLNV